MFPPSLVADAEALYQQYHRAVYAYLMRLTSDPGRADDLLQETFYRAIVHARTYRGEASPLSWLCSIGRNLYFTQEKRRARIRVGMAAASQQAALSTDGGPEMAIMRLEQRQRIAAAVDTLPDNQRLALLLRDQDGLSYETIADILGLTLANVKVTIHRARARFREQYRKGGSDDD